MRRRTRIVATLGPATDDPRQLEAVLAAGVDVARVNFSQATAAENQRRIESARHTAARMQRPLGVLGDLPGPKLRVVLQAPLPLEPAREVSLALTGGAHADIALTEPEVLREVGHDHRILLDDGRLQLRAVRAEDDRLVARVAVGGLLQPNKGVNLPDTHLSLPALTTRDREALASAARAGVDWLALSFVRGPAAAAELRGAAGALGLHAPVLAKVERPEAVARAREIVDAFDGIMVARGDLGVEIPLEQVPHVQKRLIRLARHAGKPVITATDMLDSMRCNPRPTRAEASDVANAIYDGTDAVMLSGETAVGRYPVEAVACMDRIARETEAHREEDPDEGSVPRGTIEDHVSHVACALAHEIHADAIVAPTYSGRTPRLIARHRPRAAIVAPAPDPAIVTRMALVWGLTPILMSDTGRPGEDRLAAAVRSGVVHRALRAGDLVVVLAGHPVEGAGPFPTIRVVRVGQDGASSEP